MLSENTLRRLRPLRMLTAAAAVIAAVFAASCAPLFAAESASEHAQYAEGEALVTIRMEQPANGEAPAHADMTEAAQSTVQRIGAYVAEIYPELSRGTGSVIAHVRSSSMSADELIDALKSLPNVLSASPNYVYKLDSVVPNDTVFKENYGAGSSNSKGKIWAMEAIGAPEAWEYTKGSDDIYVAILDSGIVSHDDLNGNVAWDLAKNCFDDGAPMSDGNGHGTHVAGTIGAVGNNNKGVAGVNWIVKMIPIKIVGDNGMTNSIAEMNGLNHILTLISRDKLNIAAVNMSYGNYFPVTTAEYLGSTFTNGILKTFEGLERSPMIAMSAGNDSLKVSGDQKAPHYPSNVSTVLNNAVSVAAIDYKFQAAGYTNYSSTSVDVAAPGGQYDIDLIFSTSADQTGKSYKGMVGTSMATPHVTGAAALLAARLQEEGRPWNGRILKELLIKNTSSDVNPAKGTPSEKISRYGLIRVDNAMRSLYIKVTSAAMTVNGAVNGDTLIIGNDYDMTLTVQPADAAVKSVVWGTSSPDVISIVSSSDSTASLHPAKEGGSNITAVVTGRDGSSVTASLTLTVSAPTGSGHVHTPKSEWTYDGTHHWHKCAADDGWTASEDVHGPKTVRWSVTDDKTQHYKICSTCGAEYAKNAHTESTSYVNTDPSGHYKTCTVCEYKIGSEGHKPGSYITNETDKHYKTCTVCGRRSDEGRHSVGDKMKHTTQNHYWECSVCKGTYSSEAHNFGAWTDSDENVHTRVCANTACGAAETAPHADKNNDNECDGCGRAMTAGTTHNTHTWVWNTGSSTEHWQNCTGCSETRNRAQHSLEWRKSDGQHWQVCGTCGYEGAKSQHTVDTTKYANDGVNHWNLCSVCSSPVSVREHDMKWSSAADGHMRICSVCTYKSGSSPHSDSGKDGRCDTCGASMGTPGGNDGSPSPSTPASPLPSSDPYDTPSGGGLPAYPSQPQLPEIYEILDSSTSVGGVSTGAGKVVTWRGSGTISVRSNAEVTSFVEVRVDGVKVERVVNGRENYYVTRGSTVVTFSELFLASLGEGKHDFDIISKSGNGTYGRASSSFSIEKHGSSGSGGSKSSGSGCDAAGACALALFAAVPMLSKRRRQRGANA